MPHRILSREVEPRVEDDQEADAQDQRGKEKPKPVQKEVRIESQSRQPVETGRDDLSGKDSRCMQQQANEGKKGGQPGGRCRGISSGADQQGWKNGAKKGQGRNQKQGHVQFSRVGLGEF